MALDAAEVECLRIGLRRLIDWANAESIPSGRWLVPDDYSGVGYAIIDAVMAVRQDYHQKVAPMMAHLESTYGSDTPSHDINWLLALFDTVADGATGEDRGRALATKLFDNNTKIAGRYKGLIMEFLARRLAKYTSPAVSSGLSTKDDWFPLRASGVAGRLERNRLRANIAGSSGIAGVGEATSRYLMILMGCPEVKPDQHTTWFVIDHSGTHQTLSECQVAETLTDACEYAISNGWTPHSLRDIDHLIWNCKSQHQKHPGDGFNC
jgi:hypothetical protein